MTTLALTEVQFDQSIYPRAEWSQSTVNRYAESLTAGDEFPPIVLEPGSNRLNGLVEQPSLFDLSA